MMTMTTPTEYEPIQLRIGDQYPKHLRYENQTEGLLATLHGAGLLFTFFVTDPTDKEVDDVEHGAFQLRAAHDTHTILFLLQLGSQQWCDCPFSMYRSAVRQIPPDPGEGYSWPIEIVLVDSATNIIKAMRLVTANRAFCLQLGEWMHDQLSRPDDPDLHAKQVQHYMRSTTKGLAQRATLKYAQRECEN
jgi:hypothetical protein